MKLNTNEWEATVDSWRMSPDYDMIDYDRIRIDDIKYFIVHQLQKAREEEAYLWFNTWFSRTIKPGNQDFGKWASERLQTLGVNHSELDQDNK